MSKRYLLHFVHEHITFRWTEFTSLASKHDCKFRLLSDSEHIKSKPYIIVELVSGSHEEDLIRCARDSYLLKGLYELWAQSHESLEHLALVAAKSEEFLSQTYSSPEQTFRVNCLSFGSKLTQETKVKWIQKMEFMETFDARPNLSRPKQTYCIFEMNGQTKVTSLWKKEYFFGRQIVESNRSAIEKYSLKRRRFIANTSMDPMLSLITANCAKVKPSDLVYDPFVGSGSLLIAAAHKGAKTLGADIDWPLLHGKSRPSRKGQQMRAEGEGVRANFQQYSLGDNYIDVFVSDITRSPLRNDLIFDAIISDPPYGIRECSEKIGSKRERKVISDDKVRYPAKMAYKLQDLYSDLLTLAAEHLKIRGRLVFYLPIAKDSKYKAKDFIPRHRCLELVSFCEQALTSKASRLLIVMEKTKRPEDDDQAYVPHIVDGISFRDNYFNKVT